MRNLLAFLCAIVMLFTLAACGNSGQGTATVSQPATSSQSSSSTPSSSDTSNSSGSGNNISETKTSTFGISHTEFIKALKGNYKNFPDEPSSQRTFEDGGTYTQYVYTVDDCINVQCFETSDGKLYSVIVMADSSQFTSADQAHDLGSLEAIIVGLFEPDSTMLDKVDADLDIANAGLTEGTANNATGSIAIFSYFVSSGIATLTVDSK